MTLNELTAVQISQLNVANADSVLKEVERAWQHDSGRYVVMLLSVPYFVEDVSGTSHSEMRICRAYIRDHRGILARIYVDLECDASVEAFIIVELSKLMDTDPDEMQLANALTLMRQKASRAGGAGGRGQITLPGYAQYKTKGSP